MGKTILTVDDAKTMRRMISFTLNSAGHEVIEAEDGTVALGILKSRAIDLVITDVHMPNMGGIELTQKLRAMPGLRGTPVLLLTTESDPASKAAGRAAGASGWIVKPFGQEQLLAVVNKLLSAKNSKPQP